MSCRTCNLKKICEVYKIVKHHSDEINMSIINCTYKKENSYNTNKLESIKENIEENYLAEQFDEEEYQKFLDKQNNKNTTKSSEIISCPTCKGQDYIDMISICTTCGKTVCGNCGTSENGILYCSECWEKKEV